MQSAKRVMYADQLSKIVRSLIGIRSSRLPACLGLLPQQETDSV